MIQSEFRKDTELASIPNLEVHFDADVTSLTSMATCATASCVVRPHDPYALRLLLRMAREREWPLLVLGGGTNTIFATKHFDGIVVVLHRIVFGQMEAAGDNTVRVGAAADLAALLSFSRRAQMMGLEFCTGIPGTVGGALAGNSGAGNWGLCDFVDSVVIMTRSGKVRRINRGDFRYAYRQSELSEAIILEADLLLEPLNVEVARRRQKEYSQRKKGQPYGEPSSGCIFKNPRDPQTGRIISAGKLIDDAGLKGYRVHCATVSPKHANFIINDGDASGEDFLALISLVRDVVSERNGIELQVEARVVGGPLTSCILR